MNDAFSDVGWICGTNDALLRDEIEGGQEMKKLKGK